MQENPGENRGLGEVAWEPKAATAPGIVNYPILGMVFERSGDPRSVVLGQSAIASPAIARFL